MSDSFSEGMLREESSFDIKSVKQAKQLSGREFLFFV